MLRTFTGRLGNAFSFAVRNNTARVPGKVKDFIFVDVFSVH